MKTYEICYTDFDGFMHEETIAASDKRSAETQAFDKFTDIAELEYITEV